MLANPIKGQVALSSATADLIYVLSFPAQKAVEARFDRRFLDIAEDLDELKLTDIGYIFWAGLQHFQPQMTEADTDALVTEIGVLTMYRVIGEAVRLAFDIEGSDAPAIPPRKARRKPGP